MTGRATKRRINYCEMPNTSCRNDQAQYGYLSADLIGIMKSLLSKNIIENTKRFLRKGRYWVPISFKKLHSLLTVDAGPCASLTGIKNSIKSLVKKGVLEANVFGNCKTGSKQAAANWYSFPSASYLSFIDFLKRRNPTFISELNFASESFESFTSEDSVPVKDFSPVNSVDRSINTDQSTGLTSQTASPVNSVDQSNGSTGQATCPVYKVINNTLGNSLNITPNNNDNTLADSVHDNVVEEQLSVEKVDIKNSPSFPVVDDGKISIYEAWNSIDLHGWKKIPNYSQFTSYCINRVLRFKQREDVLSAIQNYALTLTRNSRMTHRYSFDQFLNKLWDVNAGMNAAKYLPENFQESNFVERSDMQNTLNAGIAAANSFKTEEELEEFLNQ